MYTEADFISASKNSRIRLILFLILALAFVAVMLVFNSMRNQFLTCLTAAIGFAVMFFLWTFKVSPLVKYNRHLKEIKTGQKRTTECEFVYFTPETRFQDGVEVHDFVATVGPEEDDERLFYWDNDKKAPELKAGDKITVTSYGRFVIGLEPAKSAAESNS
ncbi:MAG: hypothetical protein IIX93_04400 [Clostridia bacterium]|nr:hypothetical protein [Clostridia bacterium]